MLKTRSDGLFSFSFARRSTALVFFFCYVGDCHKLPSLYTSASRKLSQGNFRSRVPGTALELDVVERRVVPVPLGDLNSCLHAADPLSGRAVLGGPRAPVGVAVRPQLAAANGAPEVDAVSGGVVSGGLGGRIKI